MAYAVLATISRCYSPLTGRLLMYYSPVRHSFRQASLPSLVRLACIRHAASVYPEPGSNSLVMVFIFCTYYISTDINQNKYRFRLKSVSSLSYSFLKFTLVISSITAWSLKGYTVYFSMYSVPIFP